MIIIPAHKYKYPIVHDHFEDISHVDVDYANMKPADAFSYPIKHVFE